MGCIKQKVVNENNQSCDDCKHKEVASNEAPCVNCIIYFRLSNYKKDGETTATN